jgi:hypothetical protein
LVLKARGINEQRIVFPPMNFQLIWSAKAAPYAINCLLIFRVFLRMTFRRIPAFVDSRRTFANRQFQTLHQNLSKFQVLGYEYEWPQ